MEAKNISLDLETKGMRNKQRITIYTILQYAHNYPKSWSYIYFQRDFMMHGNTIMSVKWKF